MSDHFELDRKKFLIQILIAVGISIFFQLIIDPWIYDPYIRNVMGGLEGEDAIVITSLSMWFFSFSIAYFYYPKNEIITNYLICALLPLALIVGVEFARLFFIDFLHIPPLITIGYILIKQRDTLKLKLVAITSVILSLWMTIVRLIGTNYAFIPILPWGLIAIITWPLITSFIVYIILIIEKKRINTE